MQSMNQFLLSILITKINSVFLYIFLISDTKVRSLLKYIFDTGKMPSP